MSSIGRYKIVWFEDPQCPECQARQARSHMQNTSFVCRNCGATLCISDRWVQRRLFAGMSAAVVILFKMQLSLWMSLLLWIPITAALSLLLFGISLMFRPPVLTSDVNHAPPAGSLGFWR